MNDELSKEIVETIKAMFESHGDVSFIVQGHSLALRMLFSELRERNPDLVERIVHKIDAMNNPDMRDKTKQIALAILLDTDFPT